MKKLFLTLSFLIFPIILLSQNVAPTVADATATINEGDSGVSINVTVSDADNDSWTLSVVSNPSAGTVEPNGNLSFTYSHDGSEGNEVTFTYRATDSNNNQSSIATVTITVTGVNDMPTVSAITKTVDENSTTEIILSGNDPEGTALVYSLTSQPADGDFTFDTATGVGSYVHKGNENASDTFSYKVCEEGTTNCSASANVDITVTNVNDAPVVSDATATVDEGGSTTVLLTVSDPENSSLTLSVSSDGSNGTSATSGNQLTYTHDGSETTSDSVTFSVSDGTLTTTGTVTITVNPVNDAPAGVADTYYISLSDTLKISSKVGVLRNDTDSDSKFSSISATQGTTSPSNGELTFNSDGSFTYLATSTGFNSDTFSYIPTDGFNNGAEVTVTLEVVDILVDPDSYESTEAATLTVDAANGLLANDKDSNNLSLTAAVGTNPSYGTLTLATDGSFSYVHDGSENLTDSFTYNVTNANGDISKTSFVVLTHTNVNDSPTSSGTTFTIKEGASSTFTPTYVDTDTNLTSIVFTITGDVTNGSLVNNGDGTFSYTHNGSETTSDSFVYTVSDGEFTISDLAGTVSVTAVNDAPVVSALEYTIDEAGSQVLAFASTDAESDAVTYSVSTNPTNGTVTSLDGVFTYTHNGSESTSDTFQYIANDGTANSDPVTVSITLNPVNDAPVVTAGTLSLNEGSNATLTLNASDAEGDAMTYAIATAPSNGTATVDGNGVVTYTHNGSETTSDSFTFTSSDGTLTSTAGTVTVTIAAVNDAPVISADTFAVDQFDEVTFNIPATDAEGNSLTYTIITDPSKGTLLDNGSGSFTYFNNTQSTDYSDNSDYTEIDTDTFVVKANDGSLDSSDTTLTFNVTQINLAKPQVLLTSSSSSITETSDGSASLTVTAVLVDNDFYSVRRDMNATPVSVGAENSLGLIYIGESNGKKYYISRSDGSDSNDTGRETYSTASTAAKNFGGYLAVFETETEQTNVNNLLKTQSLGGTDFWIGYQLNYETGNFEWVNGWTGGGSTMYTDSSSFNVSDSPISRRYVYFQSSNGSDNGYWNNEASGNKRYIVEFDNNVSAESGKAVDLVITTNSADSAGIALLGTDYSLSGTTLTIPAGSSSASITINEGAANTVDEPTELIALTAALASGEEDARIKSSQKTLSINLIDDDNTAVTWSTGGTVTEGTDSSIALTATLDNVKPFDTAITLNISGTATVEDDYASDDDGYITTVKQINEAYGLVQDRNGNIYVSSSNSRQIFKIDSSGNQTTYANADSEWTNDVEASATPVGLAKFSQIKSMTIDSSGSDDILYLVDDRVIKKINLTTNLIYYITGSNKNWQNSFTNGEFDEATFGHIEDITVSNDGASLYILDQNAIRKITDLAGDGSVTTISGQWDWDYKDGTLSQARFEGPQGIDMDSNGVLWVRQYGKLRKVDLSADAVTTVLSNMPWGSGDLTIDSSNNIYFSDRNEARLYKYSIADGDLYTLIDSSNDRGTVDGITKNAKIERPTQLLATASALYFTQRLNGSNGGLRKIDFINKLRIPAGQSSGTFTLSIIDDGVYETAETINVKVSAAENIQFDNSVNVVEYSLVDNDSAPKVSLVSSSDIIAEEGGKATLTFQLGDASESGGKLDMSPGLKSSYIYLGEKDNHKYYLSDNHQSYTSAKQIAADAGGYLTAIDSAAENSFIRDQMQSAGYNWESVWIGFNDEETEGNFKWVNGSKSTYVNWDNGQPDNGGGREDYAELMNNGYWNDLPNDHNRRYVIEFSGSISSVDTVIEFAVTGSDGYETEFDNIVGSGSVTIPAGQSVKTIEVAASSDTANDPIDSITYTITGVTGDSAGAQLGTDLSKTVQINDNDAPVLSWAASAATLEEDSGTVSVTATIDGSITKLSSSTININVNPSSDDTAVYGVDYEILELNQVSTFAGSGQTGSNDGIGTEAKFRYPMGSVLDASGNLYVADSDNNLIRKIDASGNVSTWAGNGDWAHDRNEGSKLDVGFTRPAFLVFDSAGNMYVAENGRQRISKIDTSGNVTHVSGNGDWGDATGDKNSTQFRNISGMAFDSSGNLFVVERDNHKVKRLVIDPSSGVATSEDWVGSGSYDYANGNGADASFRHPWGIAIDSNDNLYISDHNNHRIRKVSPSKDVTDYAGNGNWGQKDGSLLNARFRNPGPLTFDSNGDLWVADNGANTIVKIDTSEGYVSKFAGKIGNNSHKDGSLDEAKFSRSIGLSLNNSSIFVVDNESHRVRKIDLLPSITIPATQTSSSITLKGIDDITFENAESITLGVGTTSNVDASSSFSNISLTLNSGDPLPVVKLSSQQDILDEDGTVQLKVSLSDSFSSSKIDMEQGSKSEFYYLGEYKGSKYYSLKGGQHLSYDQAKSRASELGGQLAVITSSGEQDFIVNGIYNNDPGFSANDNRWLNHWIGLEYDKDADSPIWEWSNGITSNYSGWVDDWQENNNDRREAAYLHTDGTWHSCEKRDHRRFVVEFSSAVSDANTTVDLDFVGSTATAGTDFTSSLASSSVENSAGQVVIPAGSANALITLTGVSGDGDEPIETVTVNLLAANGGTLSETDKSNSFSINDTDLPVVTLSIENDVTEISENGGTVNILASLSNEKLNSVSIPFAFASSGEKIAIFDKDYESTDINKVSEFFGDGNTGFVNGDDLTSSRFSGWVGNLSKDSAGNIYFSDTDNRVIRKIDTSGNLTTWAGNGNCCDDQSDVFRTDTDLRRPRSIAFDSSGNAYIAENGGNRIAKVDSSGNLTRWSGDSWGRNNGEVSQATYQGPMDLLFDSKGNLFVLENHSIRKIEFSGDAASVSEFVGSGQWGDRDGTGTDAQFGDVQSFTIDSNDNIYFADRAHQRIKKVTPEGVVTTIAGNGNWDFADGFGTGARFRQPSGISIDSDDNLYVADQENNRIRKIELTADGRYKVSTLAGNGDYGSVNGVGSQAQFKRPELTLANNGVLYVYVRDESKIKKIDLNPQIVIPAGQKTATFNITGIDDISYESTETISITPSISGGTLASSDPIEIALTSDDAIPSVKISTENSTLKENGGTVQVNVVLTDASGGTGAWKNSDLPEFAQNDYDFVGEYKGHKYYFSKFSSSWTVANQNALELGGQMLVIDDMEEQNFVQSIMIHNGTWVGTKAEGGPWTNNYGDSTFTNFGYSPGDNETGYVRTYGNQWYSHDNNDNTHFIVEFGPVKTSELPSSVNLVFTGDATGEDYTSSVTETVTVPAGSQSASFVLTGIDDALDETIETISIALADPQNVELSAESSLNVKISDDEAPVVSFTTSATEIPENAGTTVVTATLSNAKLEPTTVSLSLEGSATVLEDYNVSAIYGYSNFAGQTDNTGSRDGVGENARFSRNLDLIEYVDNTLLVVDNDAHTIKRVYSDGSVNRFIGKDYQCGGDRNGDALEIKICNPLHVAADLSNGNVFWIDGHYVMGYNASDNQVSVVFDGNQGHSWFAGITVLNGEIYFSELDNHVIHKLSWNGSGFDRTVVAGSIGNPREWWIWDGNPNTDRNDPVPALTNSLRYPSNLTADPVNNKIYIGMSMWNWDQSERSHLFALDLDTETISVLKNSAYYLASLVGGNPVPLGKVSVDSEGTVYAPSEFGLVAVINFNEDGDDYVSRVIAEEDMKRTRATAVMNGALYVANQTTIGKVGLGATIDIASGTKSNTITFDAFKDVSFEEDETIDIKVGSISNGTSASNDIEVVTVIESTRLTKVESPFEGVENGKVSWGDYDRDGDMDLLLMGQGSDGTITNVYRNDGNDDDGNPIFINTNQNFTKFIGGDIEFVDVDQDGWLDVAVTGISPQGRKSELYMNRNGEFFELNTAYNVEGLSQSDMEWADLDDDSDQDLIITGIDDNNQNQAYYYTNLGNFNFLKEELFRNFSEGVQRGEIDIVDRDKDGDNDLYITGVSGNNNQDVNRRDYVNTYYYRNPFTNVGTGLADGNTEYLDIDGDGELDYLTIGRRDNNSEQVALESNLNTFNLPLLKNVDFDFADYNNDGMSDLIITGEDQNSGNAVSKLFLTFKELYGSDYRLIESNLEIDGLRESSAKWIDYDKDGDLDLFLTGLDLEGKPKSLLYKAENRFNTNNAPSAPKNLQVFPYGGNGNMWIQWEAPDDDNSTSFRYAVRIGTEPGASDILYANSITDPSSENYGSTLIDINGLVTRNNINVTVLPGTYYISVQAIDGGNVGGPFSEEVSVDANYPWNFQRLGGIIDRRLLTEPSSQIKFLDMDKDGDMDLIGSNVGTRYSGKNAINVLSFQNDIFEPKRGYMGGDSTFELADFNNDGNEDIIVSVDEGTGSRITVLLNTYDQDEQREDGNREYFTERNLFDGGENFFPSLFNVKFAIKDLNNDGILEIIAAGESSKISSEATAKIGIVSIIPFNDDKSLGFDNFRFSDITDLGGEELSDLSFSSYDFGDIDNDGDFDFLISGYSFEGYKTYLYENTRKLDENGAVVQPIEVNYELTDNNFVSVKDGTTQFVDIDQDGKLDIIFSGQSSEGDVFRAYKNTGNIDNFASIDIGLPAVRDGNFIFGDIFGEGRNDVIYSGTVTGQGTFSRIAYLPPGETKYIESNYDLFVDDGKIGLADFDGDLDTDLVLTGKWRDDLSNNDYRGFVYINVRGYNGDAGVVNNSEGDIRTSGANGIRQQGRNDDSSQGSSLNTRPLPPSQITVQRQRIAEKSYEVVLSWNSGTDAETPDEGLTYSLMIGTSEGAQDILSSGANADGVRSTGTKGNAENNRSWKVVLDEGDYYVAVQSVDASFIGSEFSESLKFTVASSFKLGDSNGDDTVNILDLTSNVDYILGNTPTVFVNEVADVNGDGEINVADISGIVNIIMNDGQAGVARGSDYDPYDWTYFSNKPVGDATLVRRDGRIYLENDKPVTSLQFTIDSSVEYDLSEEMDNLTVVNFVEDGQRTFLIYSFNNQPIDELSDVIFDYLDLNDGDEFEISNMTAGTKNGLLLKLKYSDESFFDESENIIQIYPNPAVSNVNLLTDITKKVETIEVDVFNVLGVSVYKTKIDAIGRLNDLDVSMLSSGVYTVRVRMITGNNEEIINVHKLIKK